MYANRFGYNANNDNLISIVDPVENETRYVYDLHDRVLREIDPLGKETGYADDAVDNLVVMSDRNYHIVKTIDPLGGESETRYDVLGRVTAEIDEHHNEIRYFYDNRDRLKTIENANLDRVDYTYDGVGNVRTVSDGHWFSPNESLSSFSVRNTELQVKS